MFTVVKKEDILIDEGFFNPLEGKYFERLVESIKECGLLNPIVVKREGNKYRIIDGRNRFRAICTLGIDEIPVYIVNVNYNEDTIYQYDSELCRRHLDTEEIERKWIHERQKYFDTVKKSVKRKILGILGVEETETIRGFLDSLTLRQLLELKTQLQSVSTFPKFMNTLAKHVLSQVKSIAEVNGVKEEIEKVSNQYYLKQIDELRNQLKEKEESLLELEIKLNEMVKEKEQLEEQLDTIRKATQKKLEDLAKKLAEEKDRQIKELEQEIIKLKAQQAPAEALEKLVSEFEERYKKAITEIEEKHQKEEAEYRSRISELQTEILNLRNVLQSEKESKEKLEKDLQFIIAERERIRDKLNDLSKAYREVTSERALLNQIKALREHLHLTLQIAYNLISFDPDYISQIKHAWKDVKGLYRELEEYIEKTVIPAGTPRQEQTIDQNVQEERKKSS